MNEDNFKQDECKAKHNFLPLGFQKISSDDTKVEVVAATCCSRCGLFRTKILYFDRQKDKSKFDIGGNNN